MTPLAEPARAARRKRKVKVGMVVSNRMAKTIVVRVNRSVKHPMYGRFIKQTSTFKAHDEANEAAIGDWVKIMESRPFSKDKRWRLVSVLQRASSAPPVPGGEAEQPAPKTRPQVSQEQQPA